MSAPRWLALRSLDRGLWELHGHQRSPWAARPCFVVCEGRGPGPRNVLVELEDGARLVTIRRDKSLRELRAGERQCQLLG